ncbi:MAG: DUF4177 domain-containing protein [Opitutaceae bacterium]
MNKNTYLVPLFIALLSSAFADQPIKTSSIIEQKTVNCSCDQHPTFEYKVATTGAHSIQRILDEHGEEGWELVSVIHRESSNTFLYFLKRPSAS